MNITGERMLGVRVVSAAGCTEVRRRIVVSWLIRTSARQTPSDALARRAATTAEHEMSDSLQVRMG